VAKHLLRLQFEESAELPINDFMRDDTLLKVSTTDPWYANINNYIMASYIPLGAAKKKIIRDNRLHLWDDSYLYQVCADGLPRRCIPAFETWKILDHCHASPYGGHYGAFRTNAKVWQSSFYCPTMYDDAKLFVRHCCQCQRHGNINTRDAMPLTLNLHIDIFDVWGIGFMGPFPNSEGCQYILVVVDYVSKWVEALPCRATNVMHSKKMFHEVIFPRYGVSRIVISDEGSHFIDRTFWKALSKVGVDHQIATPYHPQTSGQAETSNKQIKNILQKTVNQMGRSWSSNLSEALWAYQMAYKMLISMTPYQLVYGKTCYLPVELEHKAFWAIKKWNMDFKAVRTKGKFRLPNLRNGGKRLTTVPSYIKKEPKDGMTSESRPNNSSREIRYFSLTLVFIYLVTASFVVSGKTPT
jgi:hypothetical protein